MNILLIDSKSQN